MPFMEREKLVSSDISLETQAGRAAAKSKPKGAGSTLPPGKGSGPMRSFCSEDKKDVGAKRSLPRRGKYEHFRTHPLDR